MLKSRHIYVFVSGSPDFCFLLGELSTYSFKSSSGNAGLSGVVGFYFGLFA